MQFKKFAITLYLHFVAALSIKSNARFIDLLLMPGNSFITTYAVSWLHLLPPSLWPGQPLGVDKHIPQTLHG